MAHNAAADAARGDVISKEVQDAYWNEWQQTQDHWLALSAALASRPIEAEAVAPAAWESPEEWEIEQRAFHAVGRDDVPVDVQQLVAKLWAMYCHAAAPATEQEIA